jgi:hypothetical protein
MMDEETLGDLVGADLRVTTPDGQTITLMHVDEVRYYEQLLRKYTEDYNFTNIADLTTLSSILYYETLMFRYQKWGLSGKMYDGKPANPKGVGDDSKTASTELRQLRKALGIDRVTREAGQGETIAEYIHNLGIRAKRFGVMRNKQAEKAITLWRALMAETGCHLRSDEEERVEFKRHAEDVVQWIVDHMDEFNEIDEAFRRDDQCMWVRDM